MALVQICKKKLNFQGGLQVFIINLIHNDDDDDLNNTCRPVVPCVHLIIWAVFIFLIFTRPIPLALCHEHWELDCLQLHSIVVVYCVIQSTPNP